MSFLESLKKRRTYYDINDNVDAKKEEIVKTIEEVITLTPDAFNMQSTKVIVVFEKEQKELWDLVEEAFNGAVSAEKIESFRKGYGTVLYYIDNDIVNRLQKQFELYAQNFPIWANQASGMAQFNVWTALRELGLGASLQHYNPVIDEAIKNRFDIPESWTLVSQMPFGAIGSEPIAKPEVDIKSRVFVK